jgi:hypothetical protein
MIDRYQTNKNPMEANQIAAAPSQENKKPWHSPRLETFGEIETETATLSKNGPAHDGASPHS